MQLYYLSKKTPENNFFTFPSVSHFMILRAFGKTVYNEKKFREEKRIKRVGKKEKCHATGNNRRK